MEWINIHTRKPDKKGKILTCNSDGRCTVAKWDKTIGWTWDFGVNSHKLGLRFMWWMPIPLTPLDS